MILAHHRGHNTPTLMGLWDTPWDCPDVATPFGAYEYKIRKLDINLRLTLTCIEKTCRLAPANLTERRAHLDAELQRNAS